MTLAEDQWLSAGYAVSQTDWGHTGFANALVSPWVRIDDFGYLSFHLEAIESKAVFDRYYAGTSSQRARRSSSTPRCRRSATTRTGRSTACSTRATAT